MSENDSLPESHKLSLGCVNLRDWENQSDGLRFTLGVAGWRGRKTGCGKDWSGREGCQKRIVAKINSTGWLKRLTPQNMIHPG